MSAEFSFCLIILLDLCSGNGAGGIGTMNVCGRGLVLSVVVRKLITVM